MLLFKLIKENKPWAGGLPKPPLGAYAGPLLPAGETFSFKYSPGQLRGNQYKKMMTKEELEEEQR